MKRDRAYHKAYAEKILAECTHEQKLDILCGRFAVWGEAAHGVQARHDQSFDLGEPVFTTVFQNPVGFAATWDKDLMREIGELVGIEARSLFLEKKHYAICMFAPTVDMERDPRWGRNEEAYGEDPHLTSRIAGEYILGMAGDDPTFVRCGAVLKHFYGNNVEDDRCCSDSKIPEHLKNSYYIHVFEEVIDYADPLGVMTSYNYVNGIPNTFNPEITTRLKARGLPFVTGDGGVIMLSIEKQKEAATMAEALAGAIHAGMDAFLENGRNVRAGLTEALEKGLISETELDQVALNLLTAYSMLGLLPGQTPFSKEEYNLSRVNTPAGRALARKASAEAAVLLKNTPAVTGEEHPNESAYELDLASSDASTSGENDTPPAHGILPLDEAEPVLLLGPFSDCCPLDWYSGITSHKVTLREGLDGKALTSESLYPYVRIRLGGSGISGFDTSENTVVSENSLSSGNTTISGNNPSSGNTAVSENDPSSGNTAVSENNPSSGNTAVSENDFSPSDHSPDESQYDTSPEILYAGLDGMRIVPVPKEKAEIFRIMLWDVSRITIRSVTTGKLLTTHSPDLKILNSEVPEEKFALYAYRDEAFSWFVQEAFQMIDSSGEAIHFTAENALHFWEDDRIAGIRNNDGEMALTFETVKTAEALLDEAGKSASERVTVTGETDGERVTVTGETDGKRVTEAGETDIERVTDTGETNDEQVTDADKKPPVVIAAFGLHPMVNGKEERDRPTIDFPPFQRALLRKIREVYPEIILVLHTNSPIAIVEEQNAPEIRGILWMATGSEEYGNSLADVIYGRVSPAGRLCQTWYMSDDQLPAITDYDIEKSKTTYIYLEEDPLYRFGYGMTYTTFKQEILDQTPGRVTVRVRNTGDRTSDEVIQVYKRPAGKYRLYQEKTEPGCRLTGFTRLKDIAPGETREIQIPCRY